MKRGVYGCLFWTAQHRIRGTRTRLDLDLDSDLDLDLDLDAFVLLGAAGFFLLFSSSSSRLVVVEAPSLLKPKVAQRRIGESHLNNGQNPTLTTDQKVKARIYA